MIHFNLYGVSIPNTINGIEYTPLNPSYQSMLLYHRKQNPPSVVEPSPQEKQKPFGPPTILEDSPISEVPKPRKKVKSSLDFNLK